MFRCGADTRVCRAGTHPGAWRNSITPAMRRRERRRGRHECPRHGGLTTEHGQVRQLSIELDELNGKLLDMGALVESAIRRSASSLVERKRDLAQQVIADAPRIHRMEGEIDGMATRMLALRQPVVTPASARTASSLPAAEVGKKPQSQPQSADNPAGIVWVEIPAGEFLYGTEKKRQVISFLKTSADLNTSFSDVC